jgi:hypothetical protein
MDENELAPEEALPNDSSQEVAQPEVKQPVVSNLPPEPTPVIDERAERFLLSNDTMERFLYLGQKAKQGTLTQEEANTRERLAKMYRALQEGHRAESDEGSASDEFTDALYKGLYLQPLQSVSAAAGLVSEAAAEKAERIRNRMGQADLETDDSLLSVAGVTGVAASVMPTVVGLAISAIPGAQPVGLGLIAGSYGIQGFGSGVQAQKDYEAVTGQEGSVVDQALRGTLYAVAEGLPEVVGAGWIMKIGKRAGLKFATKTLETLAKKHPETMIDILKVSAAAGLKAEGPEEVSTEVLTRISDAIMEDSTIMQEVFADGWVKDYLQTYAAGAAGGAFVGPVAVGVGRAQARRELRDQPEELPTPQTSPNFGQPRAETQREAFARTQREVQTGQPITAPPGFQSSIRRGEDVLRGGNEILVDPRQDPSLTRETMATEEQREGVFKGTASSFATPEQERVQAGEARTYFEFIDQTNLSDGQKQAYKNILQATDLVGRTRSAQELRDNGILTGDDANPVIQIGDVRVEGDEARNWLGNMRVGSFTEGDASTETLRRIVLLGNVERGQIYDEIFHAFMDYAPQNVKDQVTQAYNREHKTNFENYDAAREHMAARFMDHMKSKKAPKDGFFAKLTQFLKTAWNNMLRPFKELSETQRKEFTDFLDKIGRGEVADLVQNVPGSVYPATVFEGSAAPETEAGPTQIGAEPEGLSQASEQGALPAPPEQGQLPARPEQRQLKDREFDLEQLDEQARNEWENVRRLDRNMPREAEIALYDELLNETKGRTERAVIPAPRDVVSEAVQPVAGPSQPVSARPESEGTIFVSPSGQAGTDAAAVEEAEQQFRDAERTAEYAENQFRDPGEVRAERERREIMDDVLKGDPMDVPDEVVDAYDSWQGYEAKLREQNINPQSYMATGEFSASDRAKKGIWNQRIRRFNDAVREAGIDPARTLAALSANHYTRASESERERLRAEEEAQGLETSMEASAAAVSRNPDRFSAEEIVGLIDQLRAQGREDLARQVETARAKVAETAIGLPAFSDAANTKTKRREIVRKALRDAGYNTSRFTKDVQIRDEGEEWDGDFYTVDEALTKVEPGQYLDIMVTDNTDPDTKDFVRVDFPTQDSLEGTAIPEAEPQADEVEEALAPYTRDRLEADLIEHFKLTPEQAQAVAAITDARARSWAATTGRTPEEWYATHVRQIDTGTEAPDGSLFQFAGVNAQTANQQGALRALVMERQGTDPQTIWQQTGWIKGPDNMWRFEIDDSKATLTEAFDNLKEAPIFGERAPSQSITLEEALDHPELFEAYPQLRKFTVIRQKSLNDVFKLAHGWLDVDNNTIVITPYATEPLSTLLHEVQHAIQGIEGFAFGGNTGENLAEIAPTERIESIIRKNKEKLEDEAKQHRERTAELAFEVKVLDAFTEEERNNWHRILDRRFNARENRRRAINDDEYAAFGRTIMEANEELVSIMRDVFERTTGETYDPIGDAPSSRNLHKYSDIFDLDEMSIETYIRRRKTRYFQEKQRLDSTEQDLAEINNATEETRRQVAQKVGSFDLYWSLFGEIEARETQRRAQQTAEERVSDLPFREGIVGIPRSQWIVRKGPGTSFSASEEAVLNAGRTRAAVKFLRDGTAIIRAINNPDVTAAIHEFAHIFRRDLTGADLETVAKWTGADQNGWGQKEEEMFARGFERYVRTGKAPTAGLKGVFEKLKKWFTDVYRVIRGSDIDVAVTPEVREVFDRLLTTPEDAGAATEEVQPTEPVAPEAESTEPEVAETEPSAETETAVPEGWTERAPGILQREVDGQTYTTFTDGNTVYLVRGDEPVGEFGSLEEAVNAIGQADTNIEPSIDEPVETPNNWTETENGFRLETEAGVYEAEQIEGGFNLLKDGELYVDGLDSMDAVSDFVDMDLQLTREQAESVNSQLRDSEGNPDWTNVLPSYNELVSDLNNNGWAGYSEDPATGDRVYFRVDEKLGNPVEIDEKDFKNTKRREQHNRKRMKESGVVFDRSGREVTDKTVQKTATAIGERKAALDAAIAEFKAKKGNNKIVDQIVADLADNLIPDPVEYNPMAARPLREVMRATNDYIKSTLEYLKAEEAYHKSLNNDELFSREITEDGRPFRALRADAQTYLEQLAANESYAGQTHSDEKARTERKKNVREEKAKNVLENAKISKEDQKKIQQMTRAGKKLSEIQKAFNQYDPAQVEQYVAAYIFSQDKTTRERPMPDLNDGFIDGDTIRSYAMSHPSPAVRESRTKKVLDALMNPAKFAKDWVGRRREGNVNFYRRMFHTSAWRRGWILSSKYPDIKKAMEKIFGSPQMRDIGGTDMLGNKLNATLFEARDLALVDYFRPVARQLSENADADIRKVLGVGSRLKGSSSLLGTKGAKKVNDAFNRLGELIRDTSQAKGTPLDNVLLKHAEKIRAELDRFGDYLVSAGVLDEGNLLKWKEDATKHYYPRVYDKERLVSHKDEFIDLVIKHLKRIHGATRSNQFKARQAEAATREASHEEIKKILKSLRELDQKEDDLAARRSVLNATRNEKERDRQQRKIDKLEEEINDLREKAFVAIKQRELRDLKRRHKNATSKGDEARAKSLAERIKEVEVEIRNVGSGFNWNTKTKLRSFVNKKKEAKRKLDAAKEAAKASKPDLTAEDESIFREYAEKIHYKIMNGHSPDFDRFMFDERSKRLRELLNVQRKAPRSSHAKQRTLWFIPENELQSFLRSDPREVLVRYYYDMTRHAEYIRRFGLNNEGVAEIINAMRAQFKGAENPNIGEDEAIFRDVMNAIMGVHDMESLNSPFVQRAHRWLHWLRSFSAMSKMTLVGVLRAPQEFGSVFVRGGNKAWGGIFRGVTSYMRGTNSDLRKLAADIGVVADMSIQQILDERYFGYGLQNAPDTTPADRFLNYVNHKYYKWIFLHQITEMQRLSALAAGRNVVNSILTKPTASLKPKEIRELQRLGLWSDLAKHQATWKKFGGNMREMQEKDFDSFEVFRTAMLRFVDQTIVRPNEANRPVWMSSANPFKRTAGQLKSFTHAFREGPLAYLIDEWSHGDIPEKIGIALSMLPMLLLTWGVEELRSLLYGLTKRGERANKRKDDRPTLEKAIDLVDLAGYTGQLTDAFRFREAVTQFNTDPVISMGGPVYGDASRLLAGIAYAGAGDPAKLYNQIVRMTPVLGGIKPLREQFEAEEQSYTIRVNKKGSGGGVIQ